MHYNSTITGMRRLAPATSITLRHIVGSENPFDEPSRVEEFDMKCNVWQEKVKNQLSDLPSGPVTIFVARFTLFVEDSKNDVSNRRLLH